MANEKAIVGGIVGARVGKEGIPPRVDQWFMGMAEKQHVDGIAWDSTVADLADSKCLSCSTRESGLLWS